MIDFSKPRLSLLDVKIHIDVESINFINTTLKASIQDIKKLINRLHNPNSLNSYFCYDLSGDGVKGVAAMGTACRRDGYAVNINEYWTDEYSELNTARVFVHELGHNIGMK